MGCDVSKIYDITIVLENETSVFEPRDDIVGRVIIHIEEDTAVDVCVLWCYGLVKTSWKEPPKRGTLTPTSAVNLLQPTETVNPALKLPWFKQPEKSICSHPMALLSLVKHGVFKGIYASSLMNGVGQDIRPVGTEDKYDGEIFGNVTLSELLENISTFSDDNMERSNNNNNCDTTPMDDTMLCKNVEKWLCNACKHRWSGLTGYPTTNSAPLGDSRVIFCAKVNLLDNHQFIKPKDIPITHSKGKQSNPLLNSDHRHPSSGYGSFKKSSLTDSECHPSTSDTTNSHHVSNKTDHPHILLRGTHIFPFEFQLPADLPSSFQLPSDCLAGDASARLSYGLRIDVGNRAARIKHSQLKEIIVFRPMDLAHFPRLRDRITLHKHFVISGCCGSPKGIILCDLTVNKTGFVPGESITPEIHVTNRTSRPIQTVHLTFAQLVLLRGRERQKHVEVLRLFASRLQPRSPNQATQSPEDNNSLFSESSPSYGGIQNHCRIPIVQDRFTGSGADTLHAAKPVFDMAVPPNGCSAYFHDIIHVPPLPATGLIGRQNLIHVEYMLILRLRLKGDRDGKFDQKMKIPITIGSDPIRETSFIGSSEVVPCYASFNYASGEVTEYDPNEKIHPTHHGCRKARLQPVYRYFKPRAPETDSQHDIPSPADSKVTAKSNQPPGSSMHVYSNQHAIDSPTISTIQRSPGDSFSVPDRTSTDRNNEKLQRGFHPSEEELSSHSSPSESSTTPVLSCHQFFDDGHEITVKRGQQSLKVDQDVESEASASRDTTHQYFNLTSFRKFSIDDISESISPEDQFSPSSSVDYFHLHPDQRKQEETWSRCEQHLCSFPQSEQDDLDGSIVEQMSSQSSSSDSQSSCNRLPPILRNTKSPSREDRTRCSVMISDLPSSNSIPCESASHWKQISVKPISGNSLNSNQVWTASSPYSYRPVRSCTQLKFVDHGEENMGKIFSAQDNTVETCQQSMARVHAL